MKRYVLLLFLLPVLLTASAQKIDSIYFHLYTDSLKKGFYNYINVDGKTADGTWYPLTAEEVDFSIPSKDTSLYFKRNDLFIDSSYKKETVHVRATLKSNPKIWKEVTIYLRKSGFDEPLKTNEEVLEEYSKPKGRKNNRQ
jgi:hypothetical protein